MSSSAPYVGIGHCRRGALHQRALTDCQPLQRIVCGHMPLRGDDFRFLFTRFTQTIINIMGSGRLPPNDRDDPVRWMDRSHNVLAYSLCNFTMDRRSSWREVRQPAGVIPPGANLLAFSDGGTREDCSASAWALGTVAEAGYEIVAVAGVLHEPPIHSFMAKAI
eukprot:6731239-Pyramimonas_sp.AAC.1